MKKLKFFGKVLAALVLAGGMLFTATSCVETAEDVVKAITGNPTVDNLLGNFETGTYTGSVDNVKLTQKDGTVTITWTNPEKDDRFERIGVYQDDNPTPVEIIAKDAEPTVEITGLENGKRYTFSIFAIGKEEDGKLSWTKNPWFKSITIGSVSKYPFIGRGYNAVTGEYFCYSTGLKDQIIDFDNKYKPTVEAVNSSDTSFSAGTTFSSYQEEFTQSAGIEGGFAGFSASVDVDFGSSSSYSEETSFASAVGKNVKEREYLKSTQTEIAALKAHLTDDFRYAINNSNIAPSKIFKDYGTHVMLDTYIGGRFTVNYTYKNTEKESAESIKVAVKANYEGAFSAGASSSTGFGSSSKMTSSNTSISGYTRGGYSVAFASMEQAVEAWQNWTASLNDPDAANTWSLIDAPETINDQNENTGVWLFADNPARQKEIKNAYLALLERNADSFASRQTQKWVKHISFYDNGESGGDYSGIRQKVKAILGHDNFIIAGENSSEGKTIATYDLLASLGSGGHYVYLVMEMTTRKDEALRGVIGNSSEDARKTENVTLRNSQVDRSQWVEISGLNAGREGNYRKGTPKRNGYQNDGYRVLFESKTQTREGVTGEKAYPIKEVAVYNSSDQVCSASTRALKAWKLSSSGNGNNITTETGGDDIYLRIYYDPADIGEQ